MNPRWENDERGYGVADARAFTGSIGELLHAANLSDWVAEAPDLHLLPHLKAACERPGSRFRLESATASDGAEYQVALRWQDSDLGIGAIREALFGVLGSIAEPVTYVRQRRDPDGSGLTFEVLTGHLSGDGAFAPHGHVLIVRVRKPDD